MTAVRLIARAVRYVPCVCSRFQLLGFLEYREGAHLHRRNPCGRARNIEYESLIAADILSYLPVTV